MKVLVTRDEHIPLVMGMAPKSLNVAFAIAPFPGSDRVRVKPMGGAVIMPIELNSRKKNCVNLSFERFHRLVGQKTPIEEGDIKITHGLENTEVVKTKVC